MMQNGDPVLIGGAWFSGEWDSKDGDDPRVMVKTRYGTTFILHAHKDGCVPPHKVFLGGTTFDPQTLQTIEEKTDKPSSIDTEVDDILTRWAIDSNEKTQVANYIHLLREQIAQVEFDGDAWMQKAIKSDKEVNRLEVLLAEAKASIKVAHAELEALLRVINAPYKNS